MVLDELKKVADEEGIELTDEMLDKVAGGAIPPEIWDGMTEEERKAAQIQSLINMAQGKECALS